MNYFSSLTFRDKIKQLGQCRFMDPSEFNGVEKLKGKKVVIVGCGAQGFHQGLNLRDSGLDVTYAYEDLVYVEHNAFLLQMGEVGEIVNLYFNTESLADERDKITDRLRDEGLARQLKIIRKGLFSMIYKQYPIVSSIGGAGRSCPGHSSAPLKASRV